MTYHGNNTEWPDRQVEILRKMWAEKKTATEIANCLPGKSRAAVLGKARRLGLEARDKPANFQTHTATAQVKRKPKAPEVKRDRSTGAIVQNIAARTPPKPGPQNRPAVAFGKVEVVNSVETEKRRAAQRAQGAKIVEQFAAPANDTAILLMERRRFQCAWPVGEPERPAQQMCCGLPTDPDAPVTTASYCPAHRARASAGIPKPVRSVRDYSPAGQRRPVERSLWDGGRAA